MIVQEESGEGDGDRGALQGQLARRGRTAELQGSRESISIGERLWRVQRATKNEYRYKPIKTWSDIDIETTWISLSPN